MEKDINTGEPIGGVLESRKDNAALGFCFIVTILLIAAVAAFSVTFGMLIASGHHTDSLEESLTHARSQLSESRLFEREALLSEQEAWKQLQMERSTYAAASGPHDDSTGYGHAPNPVESSDRAPLSTQHEEAR